MTPIAARTTTTSLVLDIVRCGASPTNAEDRRDSGATAWLISRAMPACAPSLGRLPQPERVVRFFANRQPGEGGPTIDIPHS